MPPGVPSAWGQAHPPWQLLDTWLWGFCHPLAPVPSCPYSTVPASSPGRGSEQQWGARSLGSQGPWASTLTCLWPGQRQGVGESLATGLGVRDIRTRRVMLVTQHFSRKPPSSTLDRRASSPSHSCIPALGPGPAASPAQTWEVRSAWQGLGNQARGQAGSPLPELGGQRPAASWAAHQTTSSGAGQPFHLRPCYAEHTVGASAFTVSPADSPLVPRAQPCLS